MKEQKQWDKLYLEIAKRYSEETSCLRRKVGAVITVGNRMVAGGYNGAPSGIKSCCERGYCMREKSKSGDNLQECWASHAEMNAICQASKLGISIVNGTLYVTTKPCSLCSKLIINAGIKRVVYLEDYADKFGEQLLKEAGIILEKYEEETV
jgi:dCMP deaminase